MAKDEVEEKSIDKSGDTSEQGFKPESDEIKSAYADRAVELATEKSQRILDYLEEKARDTSSWSMLKDIRVSIVDGGKSITKKPGKAADPDGNKEKTGGGKTEAPAVKGVEGAKSNSATVGGDWIDNLVDEGMAFLGLKGDSPEKAKPAAKTDKQQPSGDKSEPPADKQKPTRDKTKLESGDKQEPSDKVEPKHNTKLEVGRVQRDDSGRVTEIDSASNGKLKVEYEAGSKDQLARIVYENGSRWEKGEDGTWNTYDANGNEIPRKEGIPAVKDMTVTPDGNIVQHADDGRIFTYKPDGSRIMADSEGNVLATQDVDGNSKKIDREKDKIAYSDKSYWEKQGDTWKHYDGQGREIPPRPGDIQEVKDIQVTPEGDVIHTGRDGTFVRFKPDGSEITTEKREVNGEPKEVVTRVVSPNGNVQDFQYNDKGEVEEWSERPGTTLKKTGDGTWVELDDAGKEIDKWEKTDVSVDADGNVTLKAGGEGWTEVWRPDGTKTTRYDDTGAEVTTDQDGNVTDIQHPDGTVTKVSREGDPSEATSIKRPDGTEWKKEGGTWIQYEGKKPTGEVWRGEFEIQDDGDIVKKSPDIKNTKTDPEADRSEKWHVDGKVTDYDRPIQTTNPNDGTIEETYPAKHGRGEVSYTFKDGKVTEAKLADGSTWKQTEDGKWQEYREDKAFGEPKNVDLKVTRSGDCVIMKNGEIAEVNYRDGARMQVDVHGVKTTTAKNGSVEIVNPDGSYRRTNADGSSISKNSEGNPTEIKYPNNDTVKIKYDADGKVNKLEVKPGNKTLEKGKDGVESISVKTDGTINVDYGDREATQHPDGSVTETLSDNSSVTKSSDGRVRNVTYPDGTERNFRYDSQGNPMEVSNENGQVILIRSDDGTWGEWVYDEESKKWNLEARENVTVDQDDGSLDVVNGETKTTYHRDGSHEMMIVGGTNSLRFNPDGSTVAKDWGSTPPQTEITDTQGKRTTVTYDGDEPTRIVRPDGTIHEKHDGSWRKVVGDVSTEADISKVEVKPNGEIIYTSGDGKNETITHTNGTEAVRPVREAPSETAAESRTEAVLDKGSEHVTPRAEKLISHLEHHTPEQQRQLRRDLAIIDKLPPEKREAVYTSLERIAYNGEHQNRDPKPKVVLTADQSHELVSSLAHQIAHPDSIEQGAHETCAAANMEFLMASQHPERYAEMVSQLATEGEYKFPPPSSKVVTAERHDRSLDPKSDTYGKRSFSSELFQDAAVQLAIDPKSYKSLPLDSEEINPRPEGVTPATDNGERIIDPQNPDAPPTKFIGLDSKAQLRAYKELFPEEKYGEMPINSPEDLQAALRANGGPPMKVGVSLQGDLAQTGIGNGDGAGNHAIVITKIENGKVYYENSAGGTNHSYPNGEGVPIEKFTSAIKKAEKGAFVKGYEGRSARSLEGKAEGDSGAGENRGSSFTSVDGKVTQVTYGDGRQVEFGYDQHGNLERLTFPPPKGDGDRWERHNDGWKHLDQNGREIPKKPGDLAHPVDIKVTSDGAVISTLKDGSVYRENTDGSTSSKQADGSWKKYDQSGNEVPPERINPYGTKIDGTDDGSVNIAFPDGTQRRVDPQGRVFDPSAGGKEVQDPRIQKGSDGILQITNPDNTKTDITHRAGGAPADLTVITHDGTLPKGKWVASAADGSQDINVPGRRILVDRHGGETEIHDNGMVIERSIDGKITVGPKTWGPDGDSWEPDYPNTTTDEYYKYDPPGTRYLKNPTGQRVSLYPDGSYSHRYGDEDGKQHDVYYNSKTGETRDTWTKTYKNGDRERYADIRDRDGTKHEQIKYGWDPTQKRWQQVDPPVWAPNPYQ